jgi:hypothetical protein
MLGTVVGERRQQLAFSSPVGPDFVGVEIIVPICRARRRSRGTGHGKGRGLAGKTYANEGATLR